MDEDEGHTDIVAERIMHCRVGVRVRIRYGRVGAWVGLTSCSRCSLVRGRACS